MTWFRLGFTLVVWAIAVVALLGSEAEPHVLVLAGTIGVVATAGFVASDVVRSGAPVMWARSPQPFAAGGKDDAVMAIAVNIRSSNRASGTVLRDALVSLVDQRLLDRHGIDRARQPAAASAVLPGRLQTLIEQRRLRLSKVDDVQTILDEIEAL